MRLRQEGGLEKSKIKEDQDRQISELIARCKHPLLISFDDFTNAYCDRLFSRKQLNQTSYSTESDVDSETWEPIYLPLERIYREKVLEIRGDNYQEILRKSKQLQTTELMRQMKDMLKLRLKEAERNQHKCHKRGASTKLRSQERYRAAWQRLEEEVKQKKSELIASVPEVNQSSEAGDSHFLKTEISSDITGVDMSFKEVRGVLTQSEYESTKPSSTPYTSTHLGVKNAGYQSRVISTPLQAIENKKGNRRPEFKPGDTPLHEVGSPLGGQTPNTGTWVNRDKSVLVTTQKKVVYAEEDHLQGYKQEVNKLNSSRRLDFVAEEKKNMRCNTTTGPKQSQSRGGGFGRALFKDNKQNGGIFTAFRTKCHWNQENVNSDNFQEERELLRHAQTQISKYDQRLQDFSPYKPQYFAQRKIIQERIKNGNKAFKKLFNDKSNAFFPSECDSLVTKYTPRAITPNKLRATAQLREKIDFGMFKNKATINTNSGAFQNFRVNSMTARNRDLISPSRSNGGHFLFKTTTVMSPAQIHMGSRTPQVHGTGGAHAIKERSYIATPKTSMGAMKHSMSSMNTPTGIPRKNSGKVLFKGFTNQLCTSSTSSQLACAVKKPVPGYKTCLTKGVLPSTPLSGSNSHLQKIGRVGPCTLGASIGSKFSGVASSQTLKSAFKPQASRKLFQSGQTSSRGSGQEHQAIPIKYISSFTKTPFDKASTTKQDLLSSGGIGGHRGKHGAFHSPHDDIKKELNFNKNSLR